MCLTKVCVHSEYTEIGIVVAFIKVFSEDWTQHAAVNIESEGQATLET